MNKINTVLLFSVLLLGMTISFASAGFGYDDYDLKWSFCHALNLTETLCDNWWEAVADFPEETANATEINWTKVEEKINEALSVYYNNNETNAMLGNYYNKNETYNRSDIDSKIALANGTFDFDYWTDDDRENSKLMTEYETKQMLSDYSVSVSKNSIFPDFGGNIFVYILAILGLLVAIFIVAPKIRQAIVVKSPGSGDQRKAVVREMVPEISGIKRLRTREKYLTQDKQKEQNENTEEEVSDLQKRKQEIERELAGQDSNEIKETNSKFRNPWLEYLKDFKNKHPELSYKEAMQKAKEGYEKEKLSQ